MPRKHLIASATRAKQQNNARLWQRLAREIKSAVRVGGDNPDSNPRLRSAIARALRANLSAESIRKNLTFTKSDANLLEARFEGTAPKGIVIIIETLSDNSNRIASNIRGYFSKLKGSLKEIGSVSKMFDHQCVITVDNKNADEQQVWAAAAECTVIDIDFEEEQHLIFAAPEEIYKIEKALNDHKINIKSSEILFIPVEQISISPEIKVRLERFLHDCENDEDIVNVFTNVII